MIVVDASAVVALLLDMDAEILDARLQDEGLQAPHLLDLEVTQAVRRLHRAGKVAARRATDTLNVLAGMPVERHAHTPLLGRVWELRHRLTAYDAVYLALAETLECGLITRDRGLAQVARQSVRVEVL